MKNRNLKKYILFILLLFISIGFAVLTANLGVSTKLNFRENVWDVHFENINIEESTVSNPTASITEDKMTIDFSARFDQPTDYIEFSFYVVNNGTIDAQLNQITASLTAEQAKYISYNLKYDVDKTEVKVKDYLYVGQARKIVARFTYRYDIEEFISLESFTTSLSLKYIQPETVNTTVWNYEYSGTEQYFIAPATGTYKIEAWGAQGGGTEEFLGGKGGYVSGNILLSKNEKLYIYVGENNNNDTSIVFNNGTDNVNLLGTAFSGGGSTDIRLVNGNWNSFNSLKSRIMVASSGSGASSYVHAPRNGVAAGGLVGYDGVCTTTGDRTEIAADSRNATGGSQFAGGLNGLGAMSNYSSEIAKFGYATVHTRISTSGGCGYFAGGGGCHADRTFGEAGTGSSYISGHSGCVAITEASTEDNITFVNDTNGVACNDSSSTGYNAAGYNTDSACSKHYSEKVFTDTVMIDGEGYQWTTTKGTKVVGMPTHDGKSTMIGNIGNGYAKITLLEKKGTYNINYDLDGGTLKNKRNTYSRLDDDITLGTPTKEGYTFMGWTGGKNVYPAPSFKLSTYSYSIPSGFPESPKVNLQYDKDNVILKTAETNNAWIGALSENFKLKANTKYILNLTISGNASSPRVGIYNIESDKYVVNKYILDKTGNLVIPFTTDSTGVIAMLFGLGPTDIDKSFVFSNIYIEEGEKTTDYEAVNQTPSKTLTIPKGSIGNRTYKANWEKTIKVVLLSDRNAEELNMNTYMESIKAYSYMDLDYSPNLTYEEYLAKDADVYLFIGHVWDIPNDISAKLKKLMQAGKDIITTGNDTKSSMVPFPSTYITVDTRLTIDKFKSNKVTDKYLETYSSYKDSRNLLKTENTDVWYKTTYNGVEYDFIGMYTGESGGRWVWSSDPFFPDNKMFIDIAKYLKG